MALVSIPVFPADRAFSEKVVLEGTPFTLVGRFNGRLDRWVLDIKTEDGTDLLLGLPLLPDSMLTDLYKGRVAGLFWGDLFVLDTTGQGRIPDLDTLGKEVKLFYQEFWAEAGA